MEQYSISGISDKLGISKHTLRYYDKTGLVSPVRGENRYRHYSQQDVLVLQYIEVMKYAGFSLSEIRQIIRNRQACSSDSLTDTMSLLTDKKLELNHKIDIYRLMAGLITEAQKALEQKQDPTDASAMNAMIVALFQELKGTSS